MSAIPASLQREAGAGQAVAIFLAFALGYFLSTLVRGVTATLAPSFSAELGLGAADLGLLAGAYFLGFALMQLPLGGALDRFGPRRVLLAFLGVAVAGCAAFALARHFAALTAARALIGVGVSACLMAPMTAYRRCFGPAAQLRANSWMLMTGSLGMVAATLPVQWLLPVIGWRGLFWLVAVLLGLAMLAVLAVVPVDDPVERHDAAGRGLLAGYRAVWRHPTFRRVAPLGFFQHGGMIAVQSLWAGPWLVRVCGWSAEQAAGGLFLVNVSMMLAFLLWGLVVPRLYARGLGAQTLTACGAPLGSLLLLACAGLGAAAGAPWWAAFCVCSSVVSLLQPAVGQAFPAEQAGRALSAYNLVVFAGIFVLQWGVGACIDGLIASGWSTLSAFRAAMALMAGCMLLSYLWFLWHDDARRVHAPTAAA